MEIDVGYGLINTELSPDKAPLVTTHPKPVFQTPICTVISKNIGRIRAQRLLSVFNRELKRLKESGKKRGVSKK